MRTCAFLLTAAALFGAETAWPQLEQKAYVKASNSAYGARFGWAVAVDGDTLVAGALGESSKAMGVGGDQNDASLDWAGAVYVFIRNGEDWEQQAYIKSSNPDAGDQFGYSVDISGDTLVVGAPAERSAAVGVNGDQNDNSVLYAGAAYVFVRDAGAWRQQAYLKASNSDNPDYFGYSVAVDGDTIVVGAPQEASNAQGIDGDQSDNSSRNAGAVYVFERTGESWAQQAYIKASNTDSVDYDYAQDFFGNSVDIHEGTIVVGAPGEDSAATGINGDQEDESAPSAGAVYVFVQQAGLWNQEAYIKASNAGSEDSFGKSLSIHGDQLVVGAEGEKGSGQGVNADQADDSLLYAGAAYVFGRSGGIWTQDAYLKASNSGEWDYFGASVSTWGHAIAIGAWSEDSGARGIGGNQDDDSEDDAGAAYLFRRNSSGWYQDAYVKASNAEFGDLFGRSVDICGNTLAVGADLERSDANGVNADQTDNSTAEAGAVYVFVDPMLNATLPINAGHSGAWFSPGTSGQGLLLDVEPQEQYLFLSWFTYTDAESANPGEQHWFTAQGNYSGNGATLPVYQTLGGRFHDSQPVSTEAVGEVTIDFESCEEGRVTYALNSWGVQGSFPIQRLIPGSSNVCHQKSMPLAQAVDINPGMDGGWYDLETPGQGLLLDVHSDESGGTFIFAAWFTYGEETASGQRWLTAQGEFTGSTASIEVHETTGGIFDESRETSTVPVGTMTIDFSDCGNATLGYTLFDENKDGTMDLTRLLPNSQSLCEGMMIAR